MFAWDEGLGAQVTDMEREPEILEWQMSVS